MVPWGEERGHSAWCEGRERFQLSAANVELGFLDIYIYIYIWGMNGVVWAILSEWVCKLVVACVRDIFYVID